MRVMTSWYPWVQREPDILKFRVSLVPDTSFLRPLRLHSLLSLLRNGTVRSQPFFFGFLLEKYLCSICALMTACCSFSRKIHAKSPSNSQAGIHRAGLAGHAPNWVRDALHYPWRLLQVGIFRRKQTEWTFCFVIWLFFNATAYSFWFINLLVQWFLCAAIQNRLFSGIMFYIDTGNEM